MLLMPQQSEVSKRIALIDAKLLQLFYKLELFNLLFLLLKGYLAARSTYVPLES